MVEERPSGQGGDKINKKLFAKAIVFDFNHTLYDPDSDSLVPGVLQVLKKLSSDFILILYCKAGEGRDKRVSELGLKDFFKKIIFVENKTSQDLISLAEEFNLKTEDFVVVGDRIKSELAAGKGAGCKTIWFKNGKFAEEIPEQPTEFPDHTIFNLEEVLDKIEVAK